MEYVLEILKENQDILIEKLKKDIDRETNLRKLSKIKKAINWLLKVEELKLEKVSKYEITKLPSMKTGWSEFRIMNDCETDDRKDWIEFKEHSGLIEGDFIISHKP